MSTDAKRSIDEGSAPTLGELLEESQRQTAFLFGLRDGLAALAKRMTGEDLEIVLPSLGTRWTPDLTNAIFFTSQDSQQSLDPQTLKRS